MLHNNILIKDYHDKKVCTKRVIDADITEPDCHLHECNSVRIHYLDSSFKGAMPILEGLDPNGFVTYRLFRDATKYTNGTHIKVGFPTSQKSCFQTVYDVIYTKRFYTKV